MPDKWTIEAHRSTERPGSNLSVDSCIIQFKTLVEKLEFSEEDRKNLLGLATDMYLLGQEDHEKFLHDVVGVGVDYSANGRPVKYSLVGFYDKINPKHELAF